MTAQASPAALESLLVRRHLPLAALCLLALVMGVRTTGDLIWPADPDMLRDVAQARVLADGHPLDDPFYAGEGAWYNPLAPALADRD